MVAQPKPRVEEDLDDLDDVLDKFSAPPSRPSRIPQPAAPSTSTSKPTVGPAPLPEEDEADVDFAREFERQMEAFMKGFATTASEPDKDDDKDPEAAALRKAFEQIMIEDLEAATTNLNASSSSGSKQKEKNPLESKVEDDFQKAVQQAMEKLKASDDSIKADTANDPDLASLLATLGNLGLDGEGIDGDGSNPDVQGVLETLMSQLMSKEVLYEPLKELQEKFPPYLQENASKLSADDKTRYEKQQGVIKKVLELYESPNYSETNAAMSAEIVGLMTEMQSYGSPPGEIMGPLPPGFDLGSDGLPSMENCVIA